MNKPVTGIFLEAKDPAATRKWYLNHLEIETEDGVARLNGVVTKNHRKKDLPPGAFLMKNPIIYSQAVRMQ